MKFMFSPVMMVLLSLAGSSLAAPLKPVILASKGQAEIATDKGDSKPVELKQSVTAGSTLSTGDSSRLAVALAPGQLVTLKKNSKLKITSTHDAASGQGAVIELLAGGVLCEIDPAHGHKEPVFKLHAGDHVMQAKGTSWETGTAADGQVTTVVLSSVVSITLPSGTAVELPQGSVLVVTVQSGGASAAKVVNLVTGTVTTHGADGSSTPAAATTADLAAAQSAFQAALNGAASAPAPATVALVAQINATLTSQGLPAVTVPSAGNAGTVNTAPPPGRDVVTSPEQQ